MKQLTLALVSLVALLSTSCHKVTGKGPVVTEVRPLSNFSAIDMRINGDVYFRQDPAYKVEINAQQNILDRMETYVSNGRLVIRFEDNVWVRNEHIVVNLSAPSVNFFKVDGSGSLTTTGLINPSNIELRVEGSGDIRIIDMATGNVNAKVSGSGSIRVNNGTATDVDLEITGSGDIDMLNVSANKARTNTSGSGNTKVNASQTLDVNITGSGNIYYKSNPVINTRVTGSGRLIKV
jgi:hypothetical protein